MLIHIYDTPIKDVQSRETGNIGYTRRRKTTQYVLDTAIRKQTQDQKIKAKHNTKKGC
jgi:hypothetical protein